MDELTALVNRARSGDLDAFEVIVGRFQDMALAYAYSILHDFHWAEDAAQEAFVQAYRDLDALREPEAFPGWFRRIVFKHCDRITRRKGFAVVPLDSVAEAASSEPGPASVVEKQEMRKAVLQAILALPDKERTVTTLFYINGYTQRDIAEFLEVPVTTVNNRLHSSRTRLKKRMVQMVNDEMKSHSLPREFPERIRTLLALPRPLEMQDHPVREMWQAFSSCFPGFQEVELDEIDSRNESMLEPDLQRNYVYAVDEQRILRTELTPQIASRWIGEGGGPCKLITVGRVFRANQNESETRLEVFHQAEVLWAEEGFGFQQLDETMHRVAERIMPGAPFRKGSPVSYGLVRDACDYQTFWRDRWLAVAAGGIATDEWLAKAGLDPQRYGAVSFAFGLERCVMVKQNLDDIRALWRPPYVPESGVKA